MTRFIQINDIHISDRPPRYRTDTYKTDIYRKLQYLFRIGIEEDFDFMLLTGDVFHFPQATKVSHELVNDMLELFTENEIQTYIVPGSHDIAAGRLESLPKQPLGTLGKHPNVQIIQDGSVTIAPGGLKLAGLGWNYDIDNEYIDYNVKSRVDVLALHAPITQAPNPYFATIQPQQLKNNLADMICYGHIHNPFNYQDKDLIISNPGSLSRRSLGGHLDDESDRPPGAAAITFDGLQSKIEQIEIPYKPKEEVYRLDLKEYKEEDNKVIEEFVKKLGDTKLSAVTAETLMQQAQALTDEKEIQELLHSIFMKVA